MFRASINVGLLQIFQRTHVDLGLHSPPEKNILLSFALNFAILKDLLCAQGQICFTGMGNEWVPSSHRSALLPLRLTGNRDTRKPVA